MFERLSKHGVDVHDFTQMLQHDENVIADILRPPSGNTDEVRLSYDPALHERLTKELTEGKLRARIIIVGEGPTETISLNVVRVYQDGRHLVLDSLHF